MTTPEYWLLSEDKAMKDKFAGLEVTLPDTSGKRAVPAYYILPEREVRDAPWPHVLIERGNVTKASDREHRGATRLSYGPGNDDPGSALCRLPSGEVVPWSETGYNVSLSPFRVPDHPIPYDIDYTVTVKTRYDRQLTEAVAQLSGIDYLPPRFGYLEIPEDGTVRSLDVVGGPGKAVTRDENDKRVFAATYTVRVASELNLFGVLTTGKPVESVDLTLVRWLANQ